MSIISDKQEQGTTDSTTVSTDIPTNVENADELKIKLHSLVHKMGYDHGKASVRPLEQVSEEVRKALKKPDDIFFEDLAQRMYNAEQSELKQLKDAAVKDNAQPDALKDEYELQSYASRLEQKLEQQFSNEFYSKSLWLYIPFALLLCSGDLLLGDYIASEILLAGANSFWIGLIFGAFCIALGVLLEVYINNIYNRKQKRYFNVIITIIPLLTVFMFIGLGVLRSGALLLRYSEEGLESEASFVPWTIYAFFVGMSLAAPTALGCVLFIIQKKLSLNKEVKRTKLIQLRVGAIINALFRYNNNKTDIARSLVAEYQVGLEEGTSKELFNPPPKPEPKPEPKFEGKLIDRLKDGIFKKKNARIFIIGISMAALLSSCSNKGTERNIPDNSIAGSIIFLGLSHTDARKVLDKETDQLQPGTVLSVIWPGGVKQAAFQSPKSTSLLSQPAMNKKARNENAQMIRQLKVEFEQSYFNDSNKLFADWPTLFFQLIAMVSEQFQGPYKSKHISLWLGLPPFELLKETDSIIINRARKDVANYSALYALNSSRLNGVTVDIRIPENTIAAEQGTEAIRRTCLYYRELFAMFHATVLSVNAINI